MCRFFEFFKYYVIFIYLFSSSCFYVPCWLSQFCKLKENQNKYYIIFRKFNTNQIAFHMTCQRHNSSNCSNCVKINIITYISIQAKLKKQHVHCTYQKTMVACQCKNSLHLHKLCVTLKSVRGGGGVFLASPEFGVSEKRIEREICKQSSKGQQISKVSLLVLI